MDILYRILINGLRLEREGNYCLLQNTPGNGSYINGYPHEVMAAVPPQKSNLISSYTH